MHDQRLPEKSSKLGAGVNLDGGNPQNGGSNGQRQRGDPNGLTARANREMVLSGK